jgi:hypothetical protein
MKLLFSIIVCALLCVVSLRAHAADPAKQLTFEEIVAKHLGALEDVKVSPPSSAGSISDSPSLSFDVWVGIALVITTLLYVLVGKYAVSQPSWNRPSIFWNGYVMTIAVLLPIAGFIGVVIAGFVITNNGWWYLFASVLAFVAFAVKPQIH